MQEKLEKIIKSSRDFLEFEDKVNRGDFAKTIMLISKDSDYSFEFARLLSTLIFGDGESYQKVIAYSHPDLKIYPTKDKLLVADSQEIVFESAVKPIFAKKKVFIIRDIDKGMEAAQNKLLKTLEEPESNVYFILTTTNSNLVLPTIRSRCVKTELSKLNESEIKSVIGQGENSSLAIVLSEGFIGKAEKLARKKDLRDIFENVLSVITDLKASKDLLVYSKKLSAYYVESDLIFLSFAQIIEDLLYIKSGKSDAIKLKDYQAKLERVQVEYTIKALTEVRALLDKAVKEMMYNCNFIVVLENLILNILEVKYLCR